MGLNHVFVSLLHFMPVSGDILPGFNRTFLSDFTKEFYNAYCKVRIDISSGT